MRVLVRITKIVFISDVLWKREGIDHKCLEGTKWSQVCGKVQHVTVGPANQVRVASVEVSSQSLSL